MEGSFVSYGGEPPEEPGWVEVAQVVAYRASLLVAGTAWGTAYSLDFFMTGGISIIDGSVQRSALEVADACAGLAALVVPLGTAGLAAVLLRPLGLFALGAAALSASDPAALTALGGPDLVAAASAAGPACVAVIFAREIFWFGWFFKFSCIWGSAAFGIVALLRLGGLGAPDELQPASEVAAVAGPIPLSFACAVSLFVLSFSKLFEPVGEDLDEEGERWSKRSSEALSSPAPGEGVYDPQTKREAAMQRQAAKEAAAKAASGTRETEDGGGA